MRMVHHLSNLQLSLAQLQSSFLECPDLIGIIGACLVDLSLASFANDLGDMELVAYEVYVTLICIVDEVVIVVLGACLIRAYWCDVVPTITGSVVHVEPDSGFSRGTLLWWWSLV